MSGGPSRPSEPEQASPSGVDRTPPSDGDGGEMTAAEWVEREEARLQGAARAVRGVIAGTLCMEAFTVALVPGVVAKFGSGLTALKLTLLLSLAVVLVVVAFLQRRPWGLAVASALQVAVLACGLLTTAMYGLGGIFVLIWVYELRVRRELLTRRPPPDHLR